MDATAVFMRGVRLPLVIGCDLMRVECRKQPRVTQRFSVWISSVRDPLLNELVFVENLSTRGARIMTEQPWELGSHIEIMSRMGAPQARARIVYCQPVGERTFGVGLNFLSQTKEWEARAPSAKTTRTHVQASQVDAGPPVGPFHRDPETPDDGQ